MVRKHSSHSLYIRDNIYEPGMAGDIQFSSMPGNHALVRQSASLIRQSDISQRGSLSLGMVQKRYTDSS
jgi:hypothetical protein